MTPRESKLEAALRRIVDYVYSVNEDTFEVNEAHIRLMKEIARAALAEPEECHCIENYTCVHCKPTLAEGPCEHPRQYMEDVTIWRCDDCNEEVSRLEELATGANYCACHLPTCRVCSPGPCKCDCHTDKQYEQRNHCHKCGVSSQPTPAEEPCKHCGGDIKIRNPKGFCDHLYYPEACEVCSKPAQVEEQSEEEWQQEAYGKPAPAGELWERLQKEHPIPASKIDWLKRELKTELSGLRMEKRPQPSDGDIAIRIATDHYNAAVREFNARLDALMGRLG